jgi:hypothetical protein
VFFESVLAPQRGQIRALERGYFTITFRSVTGAAMVFRRDRVHTRVGATLYRAFLFTILYATKLNPAFIMLSNQTYAFESFPII